MSSSNSVSSYAEKAQEKSEFVEVVVEEMKKMSEAELRSEINTLVEQIEGAKFKLGYALSMIELSPLDWPLPLRRCI
jgi:hypothetical protein